MSIEISEMQKVLVANRGEIARRIFRTLRDMGLATVAIFSDVDEDAPHAHEAGEAVRLGPDPRSYLDHDAVIAAARAVGADAVHPGYGFLAENADFAERCENEGLIFIGPTPEAIRAMAQKGQAKALASEAGVPILDGFPLEGLGDDEIPARAAALGYPLLVKAVAGGGGKGMRQVASPEDLADALAGAAREAQNAFGNGALMVERLLTEPRHVEVQVLADAHGHVIHLFERDCSVQRRHQKIFEEAPCPVVGDALRSRLGDAAVALARAVGYRGAGTVEFLLDRDGAFYFLEMNTRLQVEHPVTEAITGLDLVRLQVEIAQGRPLELRQDDVRFDGHAVEARLYAEDPARDFLPATGTVTLWHEPEVPGLRIDAGVETGTVVGPHYDPMLAKVIAHGRDRGEAVRRLHRGLSELAVAGPITNRDFLLAVLEQDDFRRGDVHTGFVAQHTDVLQPSRNPEILDLHALAATVWLIHERRGSGVVPPGVPAGWRNNRWRAQEQVFEGVAGALTVSYVVMGQDHLKMDVHREAAMPEPGQSPGREVHWHVQGDVLVLEVDGVRRRFRVAAAGAPPVHGELGPAGRRLWVHGLGRTSELKALSRFPERLGSAAAGGCVAPMTGKVVALEVAAGDRVSAGDTLVILEAMKMEHRLTAHVDGVVERVGVDVGQMVDPDQIMVVVTPTEGEADV